MSKAKEKTIYDLKLNEEFYISFHVSYIRVPGGWIRREIATLDVDSVHEQLVMNSVFIPYNEEFKKTEHEGIF